MRIDRGARAGKESGITRQIEVARVRRRRGSAMDELHGVADQRPRRLEVLGASASMMTIRAPGELAKDDRGSRKEAAADNRDLVHRRQLREAAPRTPGDDSAGRSRCR